MNKALALSMAGLFFVGVVTAGAQPAQPALEEAGLSFVKDGALDLEGVVAHFEDLYRSTSSIAQAELIVTRPRQNRSMGMKIWTRGEDKALVVIESPPREKGMATLKVDNNLWNYMPRIKRTVRIPRSMMLASWMGSDFTNDDLVRESSFKKDYEYRLVGPSESPKGWLIEFVAKPGVAGLWSRFELILNEEGVVPLEAKYFDRKNRHSRTLFWDEVRVFDGRTLPAHMSMIPTDEPENKTELRYGALQFNVDVPEDTFSLSRLERTR